MAGAEQLLQLTLVGLTQGAIYALIALGFVTIYNVTGIINFAQGQFAMLGAMLMVTLAPLGLPDNIDDRLFLGRQSVRGPG